MYQSLIAVLLSIAGRFSVTERDKSLAHPNHRASEFLPTPESVRARANLPPSDPVALDATRVVFEYVGEVAARWDRLKADAGLVGRFTGARLSAAEAVVESESYPVQPVPGLPTSDFGDKKFRISLDITVNVGGPPIHMRALVEERGPPASRPLLARVTSTIDHAIATLLPLRRFDDVVVRLLAAKETSRVTGAPLAQVLALYRAEGGLPVFPSATSIRDPARGPLPPPGTPVGNVPSAAVPDMVKSRQTWAADPSGVADNANEGEFTLISIGFRPDISHLVWLADASKPVIANADDFAHREVALATGFLVQPIGGDVWGSEYAPFYNVNPPRRNFVDQFATVSSRRWREAGFVVPGDPLVAARQRWVAMRDDLEVWRVRGHSGVAPEGLIVAPRTPELLISGALCEGAALLRSLRHAKTLLGPSFDFDLPPGLMMLRYNCFMDRDDMLVLAAFMSACHHAVANRSSFAGLADRLRGDPSMVSLLQEVSEVFGRNLPSKDTERAQHAVAKAKPGDAELVDGRFAGWMKVVENRNALFDFVMKAGTSDWGSFQGMRNHMTRFRRMVAYYEEVLR